jgi:hypothetical protein
VQTLATKRSFLECALPGAAFETVWAQALFVSPLQPSGSHSPAQVRRDIAMTLGRLGVIGCAAHVAREYGDHPDTAVARMSWALATIDAVYKPSQRSKGPATASSSRTEATHLPHQPGGTSAAHFTPVWT